MEKEQHSASPLDIPVMRRWKCKSCGKVSRDTELLTAQSPFDSTDTLTACPKCKSCSDGFDLLCDEEGCNEEASCGWPTGEMADKWAGYRNTCGQHMATHNVKWGAYLTQSIPS